MLSCVDGFLPTDIANIYIFSQSMLFLEYYFFFNMEIDYSKILQKCKAPE